MLGRLLHIGKGEPTDNARDFVKWLMSTDREPGLLNSVNYAVSSDKIGHPYCTYSVVSTSLGRFHEEYVSLARHGVLRHGMADCPGRLALHSSL